MGEWGIVPLPPEFDFLFPKSIEIVVSSKLDTRAERGETLDENLAFDIAASRPSCDLGEELEGAFTCSEIGEMQAEVSINNSHEGDIGKVEAFRDHLGSDEDINFADTKSGKGFSESILPRHDVSVEAFNHRLGKAFADSIFHLFCAGATIFDFGIAAVWAL